MPDFSFFHSQGLGEIYNKVCTGERLSHAEGLELFHHPNHTAVGMLAHMARARLHGKKVYFVVNRQINYTNVCVNRCVFCAFRRDHANEPGAFLLDHAEILDKIAAASANAPSLDELHMVGGCHPDLRLDWFLELFELIGKAYPHLPLKAFTPVEINHFAKMEGTSTLEVLRKLKNAGLVMMPGGGAEIFDQELRGILCPEKADAKTWLRISGEAHSLGIRTNCTMLFGHLETIEHRLSHLCALRDQQDKSGGFTCFIPLPFLKKNSRLKLSGDKAKMVDALDQLRMLAISRLMLDNIPHIKAYWVMLGHKMAQTALYYGADDLDGTIVEERIGHMAGANSSQELSLQDLEFMIRQSGFEPTRRNATFDLSMSI